MTTPHAVLAGEVEEILLPDGLWYPVAPNTLRIVQELPEPFEPVVRWSHWEGGSMVAYAVPVTRIQAVRGRE